MVRLFGRRRPVTYREGSAQVCSANCRAAERLGRAHDAALPVRLGRL